MKNQIIKFVIANKDKFPIKDTLVHEKNFLLTKFCQRIVQRHTKVLFLITYKGEPICIIKTVRFAEYNERLKKEKTAQEYINQHVKVATPIYAEGMFGARYFYAEEISLGNIISVRDALDLERKIVEKICLFPSSGSISTHSIAKALQEHAPEIDDELQSIIKHLKKSKEVLLKKGFSHGDLARVNIMTRGDIIHFIDWERAEMNSFWLIDAIYFMMKLRRISNFEEWRERGIADFITYTRVSDDVAESLFFVSVVFQRLQKEYPKQLAYIAQQISHNK